MFRKHLALMTAIVVVGLVGLLGFASVAAQATPSATRSFTPASVAPGGQVVVTVAVSGYGAAGALVETLPAGFSFVSSTHSDAVANGQEVSFTLFGETSVTYTVEASQTAGDHSFSGEVRGLGNPPPTATVGGATDVTVEAGTTPVPTAEPTVAPTAAPGGSLSGNRSFSPSSVAGGGQVDVTVAVSGYGSAGALIETLPAGFSFVSSSTHSGAVANGQEVSFTLLGDSSVTYTVTASQTAGRHSFSGEVRGIGTPPPTATVGGATDVTVTAATGGPSGRRSFSPSSVTAGGQVDVTVAVSGYGAAGALIETLPAGFSFVSSSTHSGAVANGQEVSFTLLSDTSVTYTVTASQAAGRHAFSGEVRGIGTPPPTATVGGATDVTVTAATGGPSARRSFSPSSVERSAQFTVTVAVSGYGAAGALIETLPAGFSFVSSSTHSGAVANGQEVSFTLLSDTSVTYTVRASQTAGKHAFSGEVRGIGTPPPTAIVGGATEVTVTAPVGGPTARRSFSPTWAAPGGQVTVTVAVSGYGAAGALIETLPAGFSFVSSTHSDAVTNGQVVSFTLFGETSVTYTVEAPQTTGVNAFSGEVRDLEQNSSQVSGTTSLRVGAPPPPSRPPSPGSGSGGTLRPVYPPTPTPTATPVPPTPTPVPPTATPVPPAPTATPVPPTATPVPTATPTPTATPVPPAPTATPTPRPTATPTPTPVPPTATPVPPAPAATATPVPTATPTPTATPAPTTPPVVPEDEGGIPIWVIILIVLGLAAVAVVGTLAIRGRQR